MARVCNAVRPAKFARLLASGRPCLGGDQLEGAKAFAEKRVPVWNGKSPRPLRLDPDNFREAAQGAFTTPYAPLQPPYG